MPSYPVVADAIERTKTCQYNFLRPGSFLQLTFSNCGASSCAATTTSLLGACLLKRPMLKGSLELKDSFLFFFSLLVTPREIEGSDPRDGVSVSCWCVMVNEWYGLQDGQGARTWKEKGPRIYITA